MPVYIPCADTRCQKPADRLGELCAACKAKAKREEEKYERLTQKDSRHDHKDKKRLEEMSTLLDRMIEKKDNTELELCILWVADDAEAWTDGQPPYDHAKAAAEELADMQNKIDNFEIFRVAFDAWLSNPSENNEKAMKIAYKGISKGWKK